MEIGIGSQVLNRKSEGGRSKGGLSSAIGLKGGLSIFFYVFTQQFL